MASVRLAVNGTLMRGLELNQHMIDAGATFVREATTEPCYRLWSIRDIHPAMQKTNSGGSAIDLEVWNVPRDGIISLVQKEPQGLCIGRVALSDGEEVLGVLGEHFLCQDQLEITEYCGWRRYVAAMRCSQ